MGNNSRNPNRKFSGLSRRRFVEKLSAIGIAGGTLGTLTPEVLAKEIGDLEEEVPVIKYLKHKNHENWEYGEGKLERIPIYTHIPRDRWEVMESSYNASVALSESLSEQLSAHVPVGRTLINGSPIIIVQYKVEKITDKDGKLEINSPRYTKDELKEAVPNSVIGELGDDNRIIDKFDVKLREKELTKYNYTTTYNPVPGGCAGEAQPGSWFTNEATLGAPGYNIAGEKMISLTGHTAEEQGADILQGGREIGVIESEDDVRNPSTSQTFDGAVATLNDGIDHTYAMAEEGGGTHGIINGIVSWDSIKSFENSSETFYFQGRSTASSTGNVIEITDDARKVFVTDNEATQGDSGGPCWIEDNNSYYVAGSCQGGAEGETDFSSYEKFEDEFDFYI